MSASTMVETYDMPMTDYNEDGDIPMAASSSENWFQPLPRMDEDAHHIDVLSESQEVDMMAFEETTTEYEMTDEAAQLHETNVDANVIDAEVYDVTVQSSPLPSAPVEMAESHDTQVEIRDTVATSIVQPQVEDGTRPPITDAEGSLVTQHVPRPDEAQTRDNLPVTAGSHTSEHVVDNSPENVHEQQASLSGYTKEQTVPASLPEEAVNAIVAHTGVPTEASSVSVHGEIQEERPDDNHGGKHSDPVTEGDSNVDHVYQAVVAHEIPEGEDASRSLQSGEGENSSTSENAVEQPDLNENQQAYIPPPPPIFLSLEVTSTEGDQPEFVLFNLPEASSHVTEEPLLLLQHHPSLFYEPVSAVFEAFRQEEYFSHLEELSGAEMALNADELQLVISEDNIYAREVSLQDLYAMHQGVGLPGHLRLTLQSIVPRFIARYNHLRDQITRLVLSDEVDDPRQHVADVVDEEEEHVAQEHAGTDEQEHADINEQDQAHDHDFATEVLKIAQENENIENIGYAKENSETEQEVTTENADQNQDEGTLEEHDDDASGEDDDGLYDLDADAFHTKAPEGDAEHETEYVDVAEPHEEGDEGDGEDFRDDGTEGAGTIDETVEPATVVDDNRPGEHADESMPEPYEVQPETILHTTSTSSFDADDSSWEDAVEENDVSGDAEEETDQSIQQTTAIVFDEEGNDTEGFDAGDNDFGEDEEDFDESAEGILEDSTEEPENAPDNTVTSEDADKEDATSRAVLAESEKFVSHLEDDSKESEPDNARKMSNDGDKPQNSDHAVTIEAATKEPKTFHKNASKRSLDDAELSNEEFVSPPGSPGSKRTRTL